MKKLLSAAVIGLAGMAAVATLPAYAGDFYTKRFSDVAIDGFDTVELLGGELVEGSKNFTTTYLGAEFHFASAENLATFEADPAQYAPQYAGYCAWAAAQGNLAPGNPRYATVYEGKLYLNFNQDVSDRFQKDIPGFIKAADENWPSLQAQM